jgi:hypothetical protein
MRWADGGSPGSARLAVTGPPRRPVILFELNEADRHFLDAFLARGLLPAFARMRNEGALVTTRIPTWDPKGAKAWRDISPWMVWPSIYTGMTLDAHGIVAFGQDTSILAGRCIWDVLDEHGVRVGVCGSLMSFPPRSRGHASFYVPESLANTADCFPDEARALQEFCVFTSRNYSEEFGFGSNGLRALRLLLRTSRSGVRKRTLLRVLAQVPGEKLIGRPIEAERAMLQSYVVFDAFRALYQRYRPAFATLHMNHVAYMQHRFWRAAEPHRFRAALSETDQRFFSSVPELQRYERKVSGWIERSFVYSDRVLGEIQRMAGPDTIVVVATGLGQQPLDPCHEIYNPVVRLVQERELFDAVGLQGYEVLHQMNPDLTLNFVDAEKAIEAERLLSGLYSGRGTPLFAVKQSGRQVFLELELERPGQQSGEPMIRHKTNADLCLPLARFVREHGANDQSTAHHKDTGWLLAWSASHRVEPARSVISITDIAPTLLSLFGVPAQDWMLGNPTPALRVIEPRRPLSESEAATSNGEWSESI